MAPQTLIVGGKTYDRRDFTIYRHVKGTLRGRLQYRLRYRGWWGPLVGYKEVRWIITVDYDEDESPMHWECVIIATIREGNDAKDYDQFMESYAIDCVESWIERAGSISWEVDIKGREDMMNRGTFNKTIEVTVYDMRRGTRKEVHTCEYKWTEAQMDEIGD